MELILSVYKLTIVDLMYNKNISMNNLYNIGKNIEFLFRKLYLSSTQVEKF